MEEDKNQYHLFEKAFKFIDEAREVYNVQESIDGLVVNSNKRTACFVHCMRGRSRSVACVLAYLMKTCSWSLEKSYIFVKKLRPAIGPHYYLRDQLLRYEKELLTSILSLSTWNQLQEKVENESEEDPVQKQQD